MSMQMHQTSSGVKKRKTPPVLKSNKISNINRRLRVEFQSLIAFACCDSPSISGGGELMTESTMEKVMTKLCFGGNNITNEDDSTAAVEEIVCYVDQFLLGLNKFKGLYTDVQVGGTLFDSSALLQQAGAPSILTMLPSLHLQGINVNISVGDGSIEKDFLSRKSLKNRTGGMISGRTMLRLAKEVLCNCKRMQALVVSSTLPYKNPQEFLSDMNWDDDIKWCLNAMFQESEKQQQLTMILGENASAKSPAGKKQHPWVHRAMFTP